MSIIDKEGIRRRVMVLFFVVDVSGSMEGNKIGKVNQAIREVLPEISDLNDGADAEIKIAALEFSSGARWLTANGPVEAGQYHWRDVEAAGTTDLGAACKSLNERLSTKENGFMKEATGSFAPAIFLLSDGDPTDDWQKELDKLKQNNWFRAAVKVAVGIGNDANLDVLAAFTGTKEMVLAINDTDVQKTAMLIKMIKFVSVTASKVASKSSNAVDPSQGDSDNQAKKNEMIENLQELKEELAEEREEN